MGGNSPSASSGGGSTADKTKQIGKIALTWGLRILAVGILLLLLFFGLRSCDKQSDGLRSAEASTSGATTTVATTEVKHRQIIGGVSCSPWKHEKQTCTFDALPTAGFGQAEHGAKFCVDIPYGPGQPYRLQRWDEATDDFVDMIKGKGSAETVVKTTRFAGNRGSEAVTVTYWLGNDPSCDSSDAPVPEVRQVADVKAKYETEDADVPPPPEPPTTEPAYKNRTVEDVRRELGA